MHEGEIGQRHAILNYRKRLTPKQMNTHSFIFKYFIILCFPVIPLFWLLLTKHKQYTLFQWCIANAFVSAGGLKLRSIHATLQVTPAFHFSIWPVSNGPGVEDWTLRQKAGVIFQNNTKRPKGMTAKEKPQRGPWKVIYFMSLNAEVSLSLLFIHMSPTHFPHPHQQPGMPR